MHRPLQVAQLSQRYRVAGWVSFAKVEDDIMQTIQACKAIEFREINQNKGYYAVQGHSRSPMSVPIERPYATSY